MQIAILRGDDRRRQRAAVEERSRAALGLGPTMGEVVDFRLPPQARSAVRLAG
jgi:hypothetical protein